MSTYDIWALEDDRVVLDHPLFCGKCIVEMEFDGQKRYRCHLCGTTYEDAGGCDECSPDHS